MALAPKTTNGFSVVQETGVTLPSSATTEYGSEIDTVKYGLNADFSTLNKYVAFRVKVSAVSGTNFDIAIYGAWTSGGTKFLLKDAPVADIVAATASIAVLDVNAAIGLAPFIYVAWTADADEDANTIEYQFVVAPR